MKPSFDPKFHSQNVDLTMSSGCPPQDDGGLRVAVSIIFRDFGRGTVDFWPPKSVSWPPKSVSWSIFGVPNRFFLICLVLQVPTSIFSRFVDDFWRPKP